MDRDAAPFGRRLRHWRQQRRLTQLALALQAEVSARHLSWLEAGKATPSRAMVLRLAERLEVPLRERNALLAAAGYAPLYRERGLDDPALSAVRAALQRVLDAHEPWPALAVDRHWNLVAANRMVPLLLQGVAPALLVPPLNVLRISLHPEGLGARIVNLSGWREHVFARLARQHAASGDAELARLLAELQALPVPAGAAPVIAPPADDVAMAISIAGPSGVMNFITTITVFGAPHDVTLAELAIETLLPADAATAAALRVAHAGLEAVVSS